jgi:WD40 repeat protein
MNVLSRVSLFALGPLVGTACRAVGMAAASETAATVTKFLMARLTDQSLRVTDALAEASARAWRTLELALAGESLLTAADRADDKSFREQVRLFLLGAQFDGRAAADPAFAARCLSELRAARAEGTLGGDADPAAVAARLGDLTRFGDPAAQVSAQWAIADELGSDLKARGYEALAVFLNLRPPGDEAAVPLLAVAVRYHFRRAVEDDPKLFQGLTFAQLERIGKAQEDGAAALAELMSRYVDRLETRLGELKDTALTTRAEVRELRESLRPTPLTPLPAGRGELPLPSPLAGEGGGRFGPPGEGALGNAVPRSSSEVGRSPLTRSLRSLPSPARGEGETNCLLAHTGAVACVAVSPDGTHAVSGGADRGLWLWDLTAGRELRCLAGHRDRVCCLCFSPDGRSVLSSALDQTVRLWDIDAGMEMKCFDRQTNRSVAFSPDGKTALCGALYDGKLRLFDVANGKEVKRLPGHSDWVVCVAFAADGKVALSGGLDKTIKLWEIASGRLLRTFSLKNVVLSSVCFSPDGWRVLSAGSDGIVRGWDTFTGQELFRLVGHTDAVSCVAVSPDGDRAASAGHDGTVRLWDIRLKRELRRFEGHTGNVLCVAFTPDGTRVVSGGEDGSLRLWPTD